MALTNQQRVDKGLEILLDGLAGFIQREFQSKYGSKAMGETLRPYDRFLAALRPEVRPLVARDNFVNLFAMMAAKRAGAELEEKGITLAANYEFSETAQVRPDFRPVTFMEVRMKAASPTPDPAASAPTLTEDARAR